MKTRKMKNRSILLMLFCIFGALMISAQPTSGPGVDPNALLLMDFENGSVAGWTSNTINRGEKVSIELMDAENGDPVRFGRYAVKLNWDLTAGNTGTTLACLYSPPSNSFVIPAAPNPRKIGMWIYASPECKGNIWFRLQLFSPPGASGSSATVVNAFGNEPSYNNINWTGWKYHEFEFPASGANKQLGPPASTTPSYGMFRLLQEKSGDATLGRQLTKGFFIIDNVRVTTASEDITRPTISSLTGNGVSLNNATFQTGEINLSTAYSDAGGSGINVTSACFTVNGVLYKPGNTGFTSDETTAALTGLKLRNGMHTVVAHIEDNFGNIQTSTATFTVNDPNVVATSVTLVPDAEAQVGNVFEMKVNTNNSKDIKELNMTIELNQFGVVDATNGVVFAESVTEGSYTYNPTNHQLSINLKNDNTAPLVETLATIKVNISKKSNPDDVLRCSPILATMKYGDDTSEAFSLFTAFSKPVLATYKLTVLKRIVGIPGEVLITNLAGTPVSGATVYGNSDSGVTDVNGVASFNFTTSAQAVDIYAEKEGKYSYTSIVRTLTPQLLNIPSGIRSGTTIDPTTSKTIVWMANPVTAAEPSIIKISKKSDGEASFVEHTGTTKMLEFDAVANSGVTKGSRVTVTGLDPGTTYIYQVGDGTNWSPTREFTTTTTTNKFSFSAYGDLQATGTADMALWLAAAQTLEQMEQKPFFSLNVGDIVDNDNRWDYHSYFSYLFDQRNGFSNIDMTASYGNHEYMGTPNADIIKFLNGHPSLEPSTKYDINKVGDGSYASVYGNMLVIGLDWESKGGGFTALERQTEQAKWMDEIMTTYADKTWKIVTIHYEIPAAFTTTALSTLSPVFEKHNVQLVFSGHGHSFRRVQIKNGVWTPSTYTRTAEPVLGAGTMHWQLGGMRPSDGNNQRWVLGEVDGKRINFTVRNGSNEVVQNECFTLLASEIKNYSVTFAPVNGNGTLTATVNNVGIASGDQVEETKEIIFTATPNEGYKVKEWKLNGEPIDNTSATFTLSNLSAVSNVTVEFDLSSDVQNPLFSNLRIYPNPFEDVLQIVGADNSVLQVFNVAGIQVHSQELSISDELIRLEKLTPGVYFFHVLKDNQTKILKIVKK